MVLEAQHLPAPSASVTTVEAPVLCRIWLKDSFYDAAWCERFKTCASAGTIQGSARAASDVSPQPTSFSFFLIMEAQPLPPNDDPGPRFLAVLWTFTAITTLMMGVRAYTRVAMRSFGIDDWMMLAMIILQLVTAAANTVQVQLGGMRHIYYVPQQSLEPILIYSFIGRFTTIMTIFFGKTSIGFLLLRILDRTKTWRNWFIWIHLIVFLLLSLASLLILLLQCIPTEASWKPQLVSEGKAHCANLSIQADIGIVTGGQYLEDQSPESSADQVHLAYGAYMDVAFALLPVTIFWHLALPLKRRVALCALLSVGIVAAVFSCLKSSKFETLLESPDFTGNSYLIYIYTSLEWQFVAIAGCIPPCYPLYRRLAKGEPLRRPSAHARPYLAERQFINVSGETSLVSMKASKLHVAKEYVRAKFTI